MNSKNRQFLTTFAVGALLLLGIVIAFNMVMDNFNLRFLRFDLTADQVYKLSPSVSKILSDLEAPIEITYYVSSSEKMPTQWKNLERDVIDKLKELKLASKGKLSYTVFDPSAEEEKEAYEEQKAQEESGETLGGQKPPVTRKKIAERLYEKGVIPFGVQSTDRDEIAVKRVYSSIVLSYLDRKEDVIEEVRPETFGSLEYEIMSRIYKLISNHKPRIAFYPGAPEVPPQYRQYMQQAPPDMYQATVEFLKQTGYDVTRTNIKKDDPIPEEVQTLVLMVDQPLSERQLYEIDKAVHRGVRVIMAEQAYNYQIQGSQRNPGEFDIRGMGTRANLSDLTSYYGFTVDDQMFMDQSSAFIQIPVYQTRNFGGMQLREQRYQPVSKPVIIKVNPENINSELSISNKITNLFYLYGSRMKILSDVLKENDIKKQILFTSSAKSWTRQGNPYGMVDVTPPAPDEYLKHEPLAVYLEGVFPARFTQGNIPKWPVEPGAESGEEETEQPTEIQGDGVETKIIAFGCSNLFKSDVLQSAPSHMALLRNSVDALTLGDELINIRSKNIRARKIREISGVGKAASKAFVIWFAPLLFIAGGIYLNIRRKVK